MANKIILVDTSILIEYYRKTNKSSSHWFALINKGYDFSISAVTKYEIFAGATTAQLEFWNTILQEIIVLPFDENTVDIAANNNRQLKRKRKQIDLADLFIASTAVQHNLPLSTLNINHFDRVEGLILV